MTEKPEKKLFTGFDPATTEQWEEIINKDLNGAEYEKKLIWPSPEGIMIRPYYRQEHLAGLEHLLSQPGEYPFVRGREKDGEWLVREDISAGEPGEANSRALNSLQKGASSICYILDKGKTYSRQDISILLKDICLASAEINFRHIEAAPGLPGHLHDENTARGGSLSGLRGSIEYDPLGTLFLTGSYPSSDRQRAIELAAELVKQSERLPNFTVINVNAAVFHNAGGSAVQELAFSLASAAGYMEWLTGAGISPAGASGKIRFTFASGSNYFMEIAKFRAARYLWTKVCEAWGTGPDVAGRMFIHAVTSDWNKTVYDPYVNMLRSTTEAMSAILGGADSLVVDHFEKPFRAEGSDFSRRIARNTQLVLKEEAYFDKVADPAAGSYYIESLTGSLIDEAWKLFLEITDTGGIEEAFKSGLIQDKITATARRRDQLIASGRSVILGTNQYPDLTEKAPEIITASSPIQPAEKSDNPVAPPLVPYRGATAFEMLRMKTEKSAGGVPKVFLLTCGNVTMRRARAGFTSGFFGCAGFEIIDNPGFDDPMEGVKAALQANASVVVICSSDEEYPLVVPPVAAALKDRCMVVVAGYPKDSLEQLTGEGVKHFIHLRSNLLETLQQFQKELGIY